MAAAGSGSRWDGLATTINPFQRQFDPATGGQRSPVLGNGQNLVRTALVEQRVNTVDPAFYDCFYGIANTQQTVVERCYKDIGCCQYGCCDNDDWHNKYGWAVALIVIFCILVIIAFAIWLAVWLINRAKDKRQKRELMYDQSSFSSPTPLPATITEAPQVEQYSFEPPHAAGYRY